ncbi:DegT/DnrJ/EryC1/StrS family aminotransferase [Patescibacteria group bacterium]
MKKENKQIVLFKVFVSPNVNVPLKKVLSSGYIGQGQKVDEFEKKLTKFIKNPYVLTVNSGTSAIHLALRLAGVGYGDEVISTPMTCTATNWPILANGARIIWADIDPETGNIDPNSIKKNITKKTKAIVVVDWGGYPCDIDEIRKLVGKIPIIEDAAHAFGAEYKNKMVGCKADYTCFSFQAIKHLTTVDGGMLALRAKKDYEKAKLLRWYGINREGRSQHDRIEINISDWGYKFHMNDVNAAIGIENLKHVKKILKKHRTNADFYKNQLQGLKKVKLLKENKKFLSSYWLFTIKVKNRNRFFNFMNAKNIMVSQVHRRNDTHPVVRKFKKNLPGVDKFTRSMICIPVGWWIKKNQIDYIVDVIKNFDQLS